MKNRSLKNIFISIIIPVRNDTGHIQKCLEAIFKSDYSQFECIVVDDGSTDTTPAITQKYQVKLVRLRQNHGPAYARNQGAVIAAGEVLFFIDADVVVYHDTLDKIASVFRNYPEVDAVIGSYDDSPGHTSFISQYKNLLHHYVHQNSNEEACTFWSGCGAIRREIFLKYNGFDISYGRPATEDIELGFRLRANHHKIVLKKDIQVKHLKRWTLWGVIRADVFDRAVPWTIIMLRDRTFPDDLNLQISQRISVMLAYFMAFLIGIITFYSQAPVSGLALPFIILLILIVINHKFYKLFLQKRGILFTIKVIPFHILYYFYSGLGLIIGIAAYLLGRKDVKNGPQV